MSKILRLNAGKLVGKWPLSHCIATSVVNIKAFISQSQLIIGKKQIYVVNTSMRSQSMRGRSSVGCRLGALNTKLEREPPTMVMLPRATATFVLKPASLFSKCLGRIRHWWCCRLRLITYICIVNCTAQSRGKLNDVRQRRRCLGPDKDLAMPWMIASTNSAVLCVLGTS